MNRLIAITVLLLTAVSQGWASDDRGRYTVLGARSCGVYLSDRQANSYGSLAEGAWIGGFISAFNWLMPNTANIMGNTDLESAMVWLDNYCKANPLNNMADAMQALTTVLYPRRLRSGSGAAR